MSGSRGAAVASWAVESRTPLAFHVSQPTLDSLTLTGPGRALPPKPSPPLSPSRDAAPVDRSPGFKSLPPLPDLAAFDIPSFDLVSEFEKSFGFATVEGVAREQPPQRPATATEGTLPPSKSERDRHPTTASETAAGVTVVGGHVRNRSRSMVDRPLSLFPGSTNTTPSVRAGEEEHRPKRLGKPLDRSRTIESFADFAKRSWITKSRSPSPPSRPEKPRGASRSVSAEAAPALGTETTPGGQTKADAASTAEPPPKRSALNRASSYLTRIKQKPQNVFSRGPPSLTLKTSLGRSGAASESEGGTPSAPSPIGFPASPAAVPKNASYNSVSSATSRTSSKAPSVDTDPDTDTATASSASENTSQSTVDTNVTMPHPTSRDPLWATYRTLDMEFSKFAAKSSTAGRMGVVRSILVPFLRSTAYHPSNSNRAVLTAEDFDRRATILNKWWNGLLVMLTGASSRLPTGLGQAIASLGVHFPVLQPVAGVDRPALLEAITMIMMRPEWRACTSQFQPLANRCARERVRPRSGTGSTVAAAHDPDSLLIAESAEHNVRTMFVTNLTVQMALVVEKLSLRHAPMSLVNWCGKACAYAFFFVPGVCDVLVRLWGLNADLLRRVADEFGLPRRSKGESDDIVALFPSHMHKLGWSSVKTLSDKLRVAAKLPLLVAKIHWHGPWVSRWRGGDTDLLFIFCRYFHVLAQEFMPEGLPLVEKARAPAFALVHAQLLSILDSTIHRQASLDAVLGPPLSDALHGADAALTAPPLPSNLMKGMDENRLLLLLKDMLADNSFAVGPEIKKTFAEAFVAVTKAATKRTPRFEHASCFMLCDFLEEALVVLDAFQTSVNMGAATSPVDETGRSDYFCQLGLAKPTDYIDWPFWFDVGKMLMDSNNTMSEIRVLSFIYTLWDAITADPARKEAVCLGWLLSEGVFAKFFNHWSPMVRAYYMRLLCWRICRDSGSASEVDIKIFLVVSQRLKTVWSHYLWLKQDAEAKGRMPPSTAPACPAPGKRFIIIRTEVQQPQRSLRLGFDSFSGAFPTVDTLFDYRAPATGTGDGASSSSNGKADGGGMSFKKRLSLLGKVLPFGASQDSPTTETKRWEEELEQARRDTAASRPTGGSGKPNPFGPPGPPTPPKQGPSTGVAPSSASVSSTGSTPTFDAATFVFRFTLTWQTGPGGTPMPCPPSRDRIITRPRLPAPAQARVSARSGADGPPPVSAGLPPETRRVSGLLQTGLISEARNARPLAANDGEPRSPSRVKDAEKRPLLNVDIAPLGITGFDDYGGDTEGKADGEGRLKVQSRIRTMSDFGPGGSELDRNGTLDGRRRSLDRSSNNNRAGPAVSAPVPPPVVRPERPTGVYAPGAVYAGRALAEWSMVVGECNNFVDRRRDEGVLGLSEVEVPTLSVEGLGMRARG
ncbi:hypothetical protein MYCTH_2296057 [Thermothelomyces thermophilus ATCC 42464]|uniref:DUF1765-domain-containing protein n=1 Tax=Thermothelomyces thermophilus (strain ATCC 42464 / BCRC 31852 / DSM 1799) TaxID=573729 RepID=G2Q0F5_THET4|nr:uncharacterized protein MYCTH_2296057 [Thermothelomyces thermophilus ATCC 42464]AEO54016.1 hypothetical protein MYCTH_2296057 [Thermothelomyces thermophilus ATCC 42464]